MVRSEKPSGAGPVDFGSEAESQAGLIALRPAMIEQSPLPLVMTEGPLHTIGCVNPAFAGLLAHKPRGLLGRSLTRCLADAGVAEVLPLFDQVYTTSVPSALSDQCHQHPVYGEVCWTYTIWPILGDTAATLGLLLQVQDATEQQRSKRAVMESQAINEQLLIAGIREQVLAEQLQRQLAFISAITRSLGEGVYAFDLTGRVTYVNPTAERLLGCREDELLGKQASAVLHPQPSGTTPPVVTPDPFLDVLKTGITYRTDTARALHQDGHTFPITCTIAPIAGEGTVVGAVVVFRDLSEIRKLEATREEYLALLSHDLRTPLTAILLYSQQLLRKLGGQDQENLVAQASVIIENSRRMERMLTHVVERSALEAGAALLQRAPLDLVSLVRRMVEQLPTPLDRKRIHLELVDHLPILGDEGWIERVVVNLLTNALKYSDAGSPVLVNVYMAEQQARISVRDQGMGIDPEEIPHLFEKHYRVRTGGVIEGSGLGLYSSQLIVAAHGGQIWVESKVGSGSTFVVAFPLDEIKA